jgi:hypothetical protein
MRSVTAGALALSASHAQHIELADEVAEYDCAVASHCNNHRTAGNPEKQGRPYL